MSIEVVAVGGGDCGASRFPLFHQETSLLFLWGFLESSNRLHAVKMFCLGLGRRETTSARHRLRGGLERDALMVTGGCPGLWVLCWAPLSSQPELLALAPHQ